MNNKGVFASKNLSGFFLMVYDVQQLGFFLDYFREPQDTGAIEVIDAQIQALIASAGAFPA
jgi:hypothetical protein